MMGKPKEQLNLIICHLGGCHPFAAACTIIAMTGQDSLAACCPATAGRRVRPLIGPLLRCPPRCSTQAPAAACALYRVGAP